MKFEERYENIEKKIEESVDIIGKSGTEKYFKLLLADPCSAVSGLPSDCSTFLDGIMQGGLSKGVNYLATSLKAFQENRSHNIQIADISTILDNLVYLQYEIIDPILEYISYETVHDIEVTH